MPKPPVKFETQLVEGHKGVTVAIVPFDPEVLFGQPPVRLDPRRDGWLITGTANGKKFDGYIGNRWGNFFIIVDADLRAAAKLSVGDPIFFAIAPTHTRKAFERAVEQSLVTTAPKKGRADALDPPTAKVAGTARAPRGRPR
jgi:hypothetical protein